MLAAFVLVLRDALAWQQYTGPLPALATPNLPLGALWIQSVSTPRFCPHL